MEIHTPVDAFAAQQRLIDYFNHNPDALGSRVQFMRALLADKDGDYKIPERLLRPPTQGDIDNGRRQLAAEMRNASGEIILVTEDSLSLITEALEQLPDEVLLAADLPFDTFTMWLESPLPYHPAVYNAEGELVGEEWNVRAIGVLSVPGSVRINRDRPDEDLVDGCILHVYADPHLDQGWDTGDVVLIDAVGVAFDSDWNTLEMDETLSASRWMHGWLIATMRLMGQHLEMDPQRPPRQALRAAQRAGGTIPQDGYISVLRLRRALYEVDGEDGEGARLRFRHRVRGHWRHFFCPSRGLPVGDPGAYRYRYVNSFVRGPKDKPLVESNRVGVL